MNCNGKKTNNHTRISSNSTIISKSPNIVNQATAAAMMNPYMSARLAQSMQTSTAACMNVNPYLARYPPFAAVAAVNPCYAGYPSPSVSYRDLILFNSCYFSSL